MGGKRLLKHERKGTLGLLENFHAATEGLREQSVLYLVQFFMAPPSHHKCYSLKIHEQFVQKYTWH